MNKIETLLLVIAHKLDIENDKICLGSDTKESCNAAIQLYKNAYDRLCRDKPVILLTAGSATGGLFKDIVVCQLMRDYCIDNGVKGEHIFVETASRFDTLGEMLACVTYVKRHESVKRVIICVKWWHSLRCFVLLHVCTKSFMSREVEISVETSRSNVLISEILKEFWLRIPYNMLKIIRLKILCKLGSQSV